ncbi:hypothetical protein JZ751_001766 [Albula glossodonta]|uniref:Uncharacterized protein n=1 Tax=Albula glossodonta TaxID=121402 RepID=A0A8T2PUN8_9TELE|nr:hypothetical protein JZ751_001766 [Albula glossodonta]
MVAGSGNWDDASSPDWAPLGYERYVPGVAPGSRPVAVLTGRSCAVKGPITLEVCRQKKGRVVPGGADPVEQAPLLPPPTIAPDSTSANGSGKLMSRIWGWVEWDRKKRVCLLTRKLINSRSALCSLPASKHDKEQARKICFRH